MHWLLLFGGENELIKGFSKVSRGSNWNVPWLIWAGTNSFDCRGIQGAAKNIAWLSITIGVQGVI